MTASALAELATTLAVETPIVVLVAARLGAPARRAGLACVAVNLVTHPLLYWTVSHAPGSWLVTFMAAEAAVWLVEALAYLGALPQLRRRPRGLLDALGLSLAANGASALVGLVLPF